MEHKFNGYLADYLDQDDFDKGLNWILEKLENDNNFFFNNCIGTVREKFDNSVIAKQYIEVYKSLI